VSAAGFNPLAGNPLRTRDDLVRAVRDLVEPLLPSFSPGAARVRLGNSGVAFPDVAEELEGFARPLWGLVPLTAGGEAWPHWELWRRGIASGTDPAHPEYWGEPRRDQRMVEMAALGFGLAFAPDELWQPLPQPVRDNLVAWLEHIDDHLPVENNWQFFRVLVNLGLERVGRFRRADAQRESLALLESYAGDDGWYRDGADEHAHMDWYVPWALHTYGLIYAASGLGDPARGERYRQRARRFAQHHQHWFDARGRGIPYGRSLTYRFAQVAFWSALVLADEKALPWGRIKGLLLRNLRAWSELPIATRDGLSPAIVEPYSSSGSPYWALKAFLALAQPASHPFWKAAEEPLPELDAPVVQKPARWVISRDADQAVALCAGQPEIRWPNGPARYAKLAYSSAFAFSVAGAESRPNHNAHDSMLALRADEGPWRVRDEIDAWGIEGEWIWSRWSPLEGVEVVTVLGGRCPWHWRLHRVSSERALRSCEAGFSLGYEGLGPALEGMEVEADERSVVLRSAWGISAIRDDGGAAPRQAQPLSGAPGANLAARRTFVPGLRGEHAPGSFELACTVLASERPDAPELGSLAPPPAEAWALLRSLGGSDPPAE
jgi:hypothetical protein